MKKVFLIILVVFMSLTCFGCSKNQDKSDSFFLEVQIQEDGSVFQSIGIPALSESIEKKYGNAKAEEFREYLRTKVEHGLYNSYYINFWLKYLEKPNPDFVIGGENVEFKGPYYDAVQDAIVFSFGFLSSEAWRYYNQSQESQQIKDEAGQSVQFVFNLTSQTEFPFLASNSDCQVVGEVYLNILKQSLLEKFPDFNLDLNELFFEYRYVTPYKRLHSNADKTEDVSGLKVHSWKIGAKDLNTEKEVKIWINEANRGLWYSLLFALFLVIGVLVFVIFVLKFLKEKKSIKNR